MGIWRGKIEKKGSEISEGTNLRSPGGSGRGKEAKASYAKFAGVIERGGIST